MSTSSNSLVESALALSPNDRADLALRLLQSLTPEGEDISDDQLAHQLQDRVQQYRGGDISSVSLEEARAAVNDALSNRPRT